MKKFTLLFAAALFVLTAAAQNSFPRKQLIDHFTGEACPKCPPAMNALQNLVDNNPGKYIWISHHYGYGSDEYSINASATIGNKLYPVGSTYAPAMSINRTKRMVNGETSYVCVPTYLNDNKVPLTDADTSLVQVLVEHSYDAATRQLKVYVHGQTLDPAATGYKVSVLVKESNLIGKQADYYYSWEGWDEFRHVKTVRAFLTTTLGKAVTVSEEEGIRSYALDTISYTVPAAWVDTNCTVVAFVTPNSTTDYTVLNAEQVALVDGTLGGEQFIYEGVTAVPVSETYPESGKPLADVTFAQCNVSTQYISQGWAIVEMASTKTVRAGGYTCNPYVQLYIATRTATLAPGTYPITSTLAYGVTMAGYRDDENFEIGGSQLMYVYQGQYIFSQWLLVDGEVKIGANGSYEISATTLNGSTFHGVYGDVTPIENVEDQVVKEGKLVRDGKVVILRDGREYDMMGTLLK